MVPIAQVVAKGTELTSDYFGGNRFGFHNEQNVSAPNHGDISEDPYWQHKNTFWLLQ